MSSGNTYNWEMTGPPDEVTQATNPEAVASWNNYVDQATSEYGGGYNTATAPQAIDNPVYDNPEYWNSGKSAYQGGDGQTHYAENWLRPEDYTSSGYAAPYTQQELNSVVNKDWYRPAAGGVTYASVRGPSDYSGGEFVVDPATGRFARDVNGNPIPVPRPNDPNKFGDAIADVYIPLGIAAMAAGTGLGAAGLIGEGAAATGATLGAAEGAAAPTIATAAAPVVETAAAPTLASAAAPIATEATGAGGATLNSILAGAGKGALTGSAMGGLSSAMQGGDVLQGVLRGGLTGAVGGGIGGGFGGSPIANILGGAGAGATGAALSGGNIGRGALMGGAGAGLNYGLGQIPGLQTTPGQFGLGDIARGAITGGTLSSAMGGQFGKGALGGVGGAYLSNAVSPYINSAYNTYFNGGVQPTAINPATGLPWSATGSGYAGDAGYTPPTPTTLSQGPTPADMQASLAVQSPYVKTAADLGLDGVESLPPTPTGQSFVPGDTVVSKANPDSSITLNEDGSLTAKTSMGEQIIPKESANQALAYVLNENAKYEGMNAPIDYSQGDVYIGRGMSAPIQSDVKDVLPGQETAAGMFPQMEIPQSAQGAYANEPYMQQVALKTPDGIGYTTGGFSESKYKDPVTGEWKDISSPTGEGGISTAPFKDQGIQEVNASAEKQTLDQLDQDLEKGDISDKEYKQEIEKLAKEVVDKGLVSEKEAKELTDSEVVKLGDAREQAGTGKTGIGPGAGTEGGGPGRGTEAGPENALGPETTDSQNIAAMAAAAAEAGPGEDGTSEGTGNGEGGNGGGSGGGGGGAGGAGTGTGKGVGVKLGSGTPYKLPTTAAAGKGNTINLPGITNLTPGITGGDTRYELAGRAHFALGGSTTGSNSSSMGMGSSPLDKYLSHLTPGTTEGDVNYQLPGYYADGGEVKEHNPQFFSEGGLGSIENRYVKGDGDGTSDSIPAMLANGEFVLSSDIVSALGNGSNDSGAKILNEFMNVVRKHKSAHDGKLPKDSKGPLAYLLQAKKKIKD